MFIVHTYTYPFFLLTFLHPELILCRNTLKQSKAEKTNNGIFFFHFCEWIIPQNFLANFFSKIYKTEEHSSYLLIRKSSMFHCYTRMIFRMVEYSYKIFKFVGRNYNSNNSTQRISVVGTETLVRWPSSLKLVPTMSGLEFRIPNLNRLHAYNSTKIYDQCLQYSLANLITNVYKLVTKYNNNLSTFSIPYQIIVQLNSNRSLNLSQIL